MAEEQIVIAPQTGYQTAFLESSADIVIGGGQAGAGKTFSLLLDPLRYIDNPRFRAVLFRRTSPQITNPGGLWDQSERIYSQIGGEARKYRLEWEFPRTDGKPGTGAQIMMRHLEFDKNVYDWQGTELDALLFDELTGQADFPGTGFSKFQFVYMMSRSRSTSGVSPYVRATCNPDADSWVAELLDWWIDEDGYPIQERSGVIRWLAVIDDKWEWGATAKEIYDRFPHMEPGVDLIPKTFTFIPGSLDENKELLKADPGYKANLLMQSAVDRERLLKGNWKIRKEAGSMFWRSCFEYGDDNAHEENTIKSPVWKIHKSWTEGKHVRAIRGWDFAATQDGGDFTAGVLIVMVGSDMFFVVDVVHGQWKTAERNEAFRAACAKDMQNPLFDSYEIWIERENGSSGVSAAEYLIREFPGFPIHHQSSSGKKSARADSWSSACQNRLVRMIRGPWNEKFILEHEAFPPKTKRGHDDIVDACSLAFNKLTEESGFATLNRPLLLITPEEEAAYQFEKNAKPLSPEQQFWDYLESQDRASGEVGRVEFPDFL